jgi:hypothetical protein
LLEVIDSQLEHARDGLGSEPGPWREARVQRGQPDAACGGTEDGKRDEPCIELANGHPTVRVGDGQRAAAEP